MNDKILTLGTTAILTAGVISSAHAQAGHDAQWPDRPINWIVGYAAGGTTDIVARIVAKKTAEKLGQTIVVLNRPGANSNIGAVAAKREKPNGYTFYVGSAANTINHTFYKDAGYDITSDFAAVSLFGIVPNLLVVNPKLGIKSVKEYIDYAKANPGKLTCGSSGTGSTIHMSCELFQIETDTDILHVPFNGSGPAMTALLGGQVDSIFDNMPTVKPNVDAGKLLALGVTTENKWPSTPDIPTLNESGVPGFAVQTWFGLFAPTGTAEPIIDKMNQAVNQSLADKETQETLINRGVGMPPSPNTPKAFSDVVKSDVEKWARVVKTSGIMAKE
ncbi:MFS transporter [Advenella sp. S44]|uniref:Bug family tripartite tricarboxylate transporter substrate binding protein n=1 Tax=Advenella sp. S44 TaxID=1982755 RepID=UPI000C2997A8|nr:tripartite tricarboxylate transporter substrate binding protein [Advenella sp. S44]PJX28232.1 MFS transporter [Advenella sp. S44]